MNTKKITRCIGVENIASVVFFLRLTKFLSLIKYHFRRHDILQFFLKSVSLIQTQNLTHFGRNIHFVVHSNYLAAVKTQSE